MSKYIAVVYSNKIKPKKYNTVWKKDSKQYYSAQFNYYKIKKTKLYYLGMCRYMINCLIVFFKHQQENTLSPKSE